MPDMESFVARCSDNDLAKLADLIPGLMRERFVENPHGDLAGWQQILNALPEVVPCEYELDQGRISIGHASDLSNEQVSLLRQQLMAFHPWRKGPFRLFGVDIDTEWRSDWKWERLRPHVDSLDGRRVLDVGCGNGYHCWRMAADGASFVVGIDPTMLFYMQFEVIRRYIGDIGVYLLPLKLEDLPLQLPAFDTVFSMGVLYHRRSPFDHLLELREKLRPGGQLVLETLVIEGESGQVLVPPGRYAKMRNVWFIPSSDTLVSWIERAGYVDVCCVDSSVTTTKEQHSTDWMTFESLPDFLDPLDPNKTVEGHPAPRRALLIAHKA